MICAMMWIDSTIADNILSRVSSHEAFIERRGPDPEFVKEMPRKFACLANLKLVCGRWI